VTDMAFDAQTEDIMMGMGHSSIVNMLTLIVSQLIVPSLMHLFSNCMCPRHAFDYEKTAS
jgi:hypothetical protein